MSMSHIETSEPTLCLPHLRSALVPDPHCQPPLVAVAAQQVPHLPPQTQLALLASMLPYRRQQRRQLPSHVVGPARS